MPDLKRKIVIQVDGRELKEVPNNIKAIAKAYKELRKANDSLVIGSDAYNANIKELKRLNGVLSGHAGKIRGVESTWKKMVSTALKFAPAISGAFVVGAAAKYGKELFALGIQMDQLARKAETVLGPALAYVTAEAEKNAEAMGLTTQEYINAAAATSDLLIPMGFQRQEAAEISTSLINLSGALSEWTGGQIKSTEVSKILNKALLGEREQLKQLGISINEADVKTRLAATGADKLTGELLKQAKAAATLELITERSADAQTSYSKNSDSLVRKQAELQAKFKEVSQELALSLVPLFGRLLDAGVDLSSGIANISNSFTRLLNPTKASADAFQEQADNVEKLQIEIKPLLARHDELKSKSKLSKEEQTELNAIIAKVAETVPLAVTKVDEYGKALGISTKRASEFILVQESVVKGLANTGREANIKRLASIREELEKVNLALETGQTIINGPEGERTFNINNKRATQLIAQQTELNKELEETEKALNLINQRQKEVTGLNPFEQLEAQSNTSTPTDPETPTSKTPISPTDDEIAAQQERATKLAEQRQKQREAEQKAIEQQLLRLTEITDQFRQNRELSTLDEDAKALEQIRIRYQSQIDIAKDLEKNGVLAAKDQRLALEQLRDQELTDLRQQQFDARMLAIDTENQAEADKEIANIAEKMLREEESRLALFEFLATEQEKELYDLEIHYQNLLALAEQYGIDTTEVTQKYEGEKAKITKKFRDKEKAEEGKQDKLSLNQKVASFKAVSSVISETINLFDAQSRESVIFQKILAASQIAVDTAVAIAGAVAAAQSVPFPANIAAIATGVASVIGAIAQTKALLSTPIPQKKLGGYHQVQGADDGKTYNAQYIGRPDSGMLPSGQKLILANEAGPEYFVANHHLKNPAVARHVQMIENLVNSRQSTSSGSIRQMKEGGSTGNTPSSATDSATTLLLVQAIERLNERLDDLEVSITYPDVEKIGSMQSDLDGIKG